MRRRANLSSRLAVLVTATLFQLMVFPSMVPAANDNSTIQNITAQVGKLSDEHANIRDTAASQLRKLLPDPGVSIAPSEQDEVYWTKKLEALNSGMPKTEVEKLFPPRGETAPTIGQGMRSRSVEHRLSDYWVATLYYDASDRLEAAPKLKKSELSVWVPPAPDFTGKWITYYVNGQKANEIEYKDGEYEGTYINYHPNGKKSYEQHYVNGIPEGTDVGWHPNGQQSYTGQYLKGRQDGTWIWWNADGTKQNEVVYKAGQKL